MLLIPKTPLFVTCTRQAVEKARFDQSAGHAKPLYQLMEYFIANYNSPNEHKDKIPSISNLQALEGYGWGSIGSNWSRFGCKHTRLYTNLECARNGLTGVQSLSRIGIYLFIYPCLVKVNEFLPWNVQMLSHDVRGEHRHWIFLHHYNEQPK